MIPQLWCYLLFLSSSLNRSWPASVAVVSYSPEAVWSQLLNSTRRRTYFSCPYRTNLCLKRAIGRLIQINNSSPYPPKSLTEISEFQKAVDISKIQSWNRFSIGPLPFSGKKKSHKTVCTNLTCFYFLCFVSGHTSIVLKKIPPDFILVPQWWFERFWFNWFSHSKDE